MSTHTNENDPAFPFGQISELTGQPINGWFAAGLTASEHAAIHLRVPMSGNPWLDAMITEARRWDAAQAAMQGAINDGGFDPELDSRRIVKCSEEAANALTRQMKGGAQ